MRTTQATANAMMQEFLDLLFAKTDPLGYDVTAVPQGPLMWRVTIENLHEKDVYDVEFNQGWHWIRVIGEGTKESTGRP